jgi:hypothetical protein
MCVCKYVSCVCVCVCINVLNVFVGRAATMNDLNSQQADAEQDPHQDHHQQPQHHRSSRDAESLGLGPPIVVTSNRHSNDGHNVYGSSSGSGSGGSGLGLVPGVKMQRSITDNTTYSLGSMSASSSLGINEHMNEPMSDDVETPTVLLSDAGSSGSSGSPALPPPPPLDTNVNTSTNVKQTSSKGQAKQLSNKQKMTTAAGGKSGIASSAGRQSSAQSSYAQSKQQQPQQGLQQQTLFKSHSATSIASSSVSSSGGERSPFAPPPLPIEVHKHKARASLLAVNNATSNAGNTLNGSNAMNNGMTPSNSSGQHAQHHSEGNMRKMSTPSPVQQQSQSAQNQHGGNGGNSGIAAGGAGGGGGHASSVVRSIKVVDNSHNQHANASGSAQSNANHSDLGTNKALHNAANTSTHSVHSAGSRNSTYQLEGQQDTLVQNISKRHFRPGPMSDQIPMPPSSGSNIYDIPLNVEDIENDHANNGTSDGANMMINNYNMNNNSTSHSSRGPGQDVPVVTRNRNMSDASSNNNINRRRNSRSSGTSKGSAVSSDVDRKESTDTSHNVDPPGEQQHGEDVAEEEEVDGVGYDSDITCSTASTVTQVKEAPNTVSYLSMDSKEEDIIQDYDEMFN